MDRLHSQTLISATGDFPLKIRAQATRTLLLLSTPAGRPALLPPGAFLISSHKFLEQECLGEEFDICILKVHILHASKERCSQHSIEKKISPKFCFLSAFYSKKNQEKPPNQYILLQLLVLQENAHLPLKR